MEEEQYKFEDFLHLTLTSLQDYLALRGLSKSGNKEVLVARAFGAYELNAPIKFTQEQISNYPGPRVFLSSREKLWDQGNFK